MDSYIIFLVISYHILKDFFIEFFEIFAILNLIAYSFLMFLYFELCLKQ